MGCNNSKDLGTVEEPEQLSTQEKVDKEVAEYEAAKVVAEKESAEHEEALAKLKKEQEEAEAARLAALEAAGNLDALVEEAIKIRTEADNADEKNKAALQKKADELDIAVQEARKKKDEADRIAEKERLEAEEAARQEEKERREAEEAQRNVEQQRKEAEDALDDAEKEKLEYEEARRQLEEQAEMRAKLEEDKVAAAQKARDEAPYYYKGTMMKKGDDMVGSWKSRFFVANNKKDNFVIDYFESEGGKKKGSINCCGFRAVAFTAEESTSLGAHGIKIVPKASGRTWVLKAENAKEQAEWLHVIGRACDNAGISASQVDLKEE